jgi:ADP-ribose pyrophosphatase YjhB (NUDIX family)
MHMTQITWGERAGKAGRLTIGCAAVIFNATRQAILLTRRHDNGRWCLPGGHMEPGERVDEACVREVEEETGLEVRIERLIGVYSGYDRLVEYADGNRFQIVGLCFEATAIGGTLGGSDETTAYGYFTLEELALMDVVEHHLERIRDAFTPHLQAYIR